MQDLNDDEEPEFDPEDEDWWGAHDPEESDGLCEYCSGSGDMCSNDGDGEPVPCLFCRRTGDSRVAEYESRKMDEEARKGQEEPEFDPEDVESGDAERPPRRL